jgi:hypothetical protein
MEQVWPYGSVPEKQMTFRFLVTISALCFLAPETVLGPLGLIGVARSGRGRAVLCVAAVIQEVSTMRAEL